MATRQYTWWDDLVGTTLSAYSGSGTFYGSPTLGATGAGGRMRYCVEFDGVDDYAELSMIVAPTSTYGFGIWVKVTPGYESTEQQIFSWKDAAGDGIGLKVTTNGKFALEHNGTLIESVASVTGGWQYLFLRLASGGASIWVDSTASASASTTGQTSISLGTTLATFGRDPIADDKYFHGRIAMFLYRDSNEYSDLGARRDFQRYALPKFDSPPTITGTRGEGNTLTCEWSVLYDDTVTAEYGWYIPSGDRTVTLIGTGATYVEQAADAGKPITAGCRVTNTTGVGYACDLEEATLFDQSAFASSPKIAAMHVSRRSINSPGSGEKEWCWLPPFEEGDLLLMVLTRLRTWEPPGFQAAYTFARGEEQKVYYRFALASDSRYLEYTGSEQYYAPEAKTLCIKNAGRPLYADSFTTGAVGNSVTHPSVQCNFADSLVLHTLMAASSDSNNHWYGNQTPFYRINSTYISGASLSEDWWEDLMYETVSQGVGLTADNVTSGGWPSWHDVRASTFIIPPRPGPGTYSIGSAATDHFPNPATFWSAITASPPGTYIGELTSDLSFAGYSLGSDYGGSGGTAPKDVVIRSDGTRRTLWLNADNHLLYVGGAWSMGSFLMENVNLDGTNGSGTANYLINFSSSGPHDVTYTFRNVVARNLAGSANAGFMVPNGGSARRHMVYENCIAHDIVGNGWLNNITVSGSTYTFKNCAAFRNSGYGWSGYNASTTLDFYNCVAMNNGSGDIQVFTTPVYNGIGCVTSDSSAASGTWDSKSNYATGKTDYANYFNDYANSDFSLVDTSLNLWGVEGNATYQPTVDFTGATRTGADVGPFEFDDGGGGGVDLTAGAAASEGSAPAPTLATAPPQLTSGTGLAEGAAPAPSLATAPTVIVAGAALAESLATAPTVLTAGPLVTTGTGLAQSVAVAPTLQTDAASTPAGAVTSEAGAYAPSIQTAPTVIAAGAALFEVSAAALALDSGGVVITGGVGLGQASAASPGLATSPPMLSAGAGLSEVAAVAPSLQTAPTVIVAGVGVAQGSAVEVLVDSGGPLMAAGVAGVQITVTSPDLEGAPAIIDAGTGLASGDVVPPTIATAPTIVVAGAAQATASLATLTTSVGLAFAAGVASAGGSAVAPLMTGGGRVIAPPERMHVVDAQCRVHTVGRARRLHVVEPSSRLVSVR